MTLGILMIIFGAASIVGLVYFLIELSAYLDGEEE
jgi:hypothetical protein